jgi:Abortive infection alpha
MSEEKKSENIMQSSLQVAEAILEKAPIYEDLVQPTAKSIGAGLGGAMLYMMSPFIKMGMQAKQNIQEFQTSLEQKTSRIPEDRIQAPDISIAGPIVQALGYTVHEPELREMFTSLLAMAMDLSTEKDAHPAFVEIIKQLSPDEAKILRLLGKRLGASATYDSKGKLSGLSTYFDNHTIAVVNLRKYNNQIGVGHFATIKRNIALISNDADCKNPTKEAEYIDNLVRLGILTINYSIRLSQESAYEKFEDWKTKVINSLQDKDDKSHYDLEKGIMEVTQFGVKFVTACVIAPPPNYDFSKESHHE